MMRVHATCLAVDGAGVLLRGPSGSGKSDLALRLIDEGARLVADDQTELRVADGRLIASPPEAIAGLIEVRGIGLVRLPHLAAVALDLVVDLVAQGEVERMPLPAGVALLGISLPHYLIEPFEASASAKLRLAARLATGDIMLAQ